MSPSDSDRPLQVDPAVAARLRVAWVRAAPVSVSASSAELLGEIDAEGRELRARHSGVAPASIEGLAAARELYKSFGIDPTRQLHWDALRKIEGAQLVDFLAMSLTFDPPVKQGLVEAEDVDTRGKLLLHALNEALMESTSMDSAGPAH